MTYEETRGHEAAMEVSLLVSSGTKVKSFAWVIDCFLKL
jgi:hypothetical protein